MYKRYGDEEEANWFNYKIQGTEGYTDIRDYGQGGDRDTADRRAYYIYHLYNYLIDTAKANIPLYKSGTKKSQNKITLYTNITKKICILQK